MNKQEFKINIEGLGDVFFFEHSFKPAEEHARDFIARNKGKHHMALYRLSNKPKPFPKWELIEKVGIN